MRSRSTSRACVPSSSPRAFASVPCAASATCWKARMRAERSVRSRLLVWLVAPLALVLGAAAVLAYETALGVATDAYDRSLLDPALAIAEELKVTDGGVALSMSTEALEALRVDTSDRVFFSVSQLGRHLAGPD